MTIRLPPPPRTGIDQYLEAREWCRLLGHAVELTRAALTRYGATESQWQSFGAFYLDIEHLAELGQVGIDQDDCTYRGALPREEYLSMTHAIVWRVSAGIARWNPSHEDLIVEALASALRNIRKLEQQEQANTQENSK